MDATVDMAEAGPNTPATKSLRDARRAREARIRFWRACAVSTFFVVIISANLFVGAVVMIGIGILSGVKATRQRDSAR